MKFHVTKRGQDYQVCEGIVEVAEIRALKGGSFELRVHGVVWAENGEPNTVSGRSVITFPKLFDAFVVAGQVAQQFAGRV